MINADRIGSILRQYVDDPNINYRVLIDSSIVLGGDILRKQECKAISRCGIETVVQKALEFQNNQLDKKCT